MGNGFDEWWDCGRAQKARMEDKNTCRSAGGVMKVKEVEDGCRKVRGMVGRQGAAGGCRENEEVNTNGR